MIHMPTQNQKPSSNTSNSVLANEDKEKYFYNMFSGDDTYANTESETIEQHV